MCKRDVLFVVLTGLPVREMEGSRCGEDPEIGYVSESAKIAAWLDEHPDFAHDYFIRYMIDGLGISLMDIRIFV